MGALLLSVSAAAAPPPSIRDSFGLGGGAGALCRVQSNVSGPAITGMFDRAYTIVCRDAAAPVGRLYALRNGADDPVARLAGIRTGAQCAPAQARAIAGLGPVATSECTVSDGQLGYRVYSVARGRTTYVAEGLAGYDSALQLGLRTIVADRIVPGEVSVATTAAGDPAAFARVQAGTLDVEQALAEGYRRNNSGSYAEAAEFFDTLLERNNRGGQSGNLLGEYVVNRALQRSNLGDFAEADALFAQAARIPTADPVQLRLRRNFMALHLLNQGQLPAAIAELDRPLTAIDRPVRAASGEPEIDATTAAQINSRTRANTLGGDSASLTPEERAAILDAQALQLRGTALRLQGDLTGAEAALNQAMSDVIKVREGRVTSITRLRAQTMAELSAIAEARGDFARAEQLLRGGQLLLDTEYPRSAAANATKARLAAFLARRGQTEPALALFREVVQTIGETGASSAGLSNLLSPYFALLVTRPALVDDFFLASETVVRPGVADTQAVLARELSGGSDEAARLFRQSVTLTRDVERTRVELARIGALPEPTPDDLARGAALRANLAALEADQVATQAKLAEYPRFRALSTVALALPDLRAALAPGEAYLKLVLVGSEVYAIYATPADAVAYRATLSAGDLARRVQGLRDTIAKDENGQLLTYPFDVKAARALFVDLMGPVADRIAATRHLIFEPDGAMLQLPVNLLIEDQASVDAYLARQSAPKADEFDFRGLAWLGAKTDVSTAVSARAFRDVRRIAPSTAPKQYIGFGQNQPVSNVTEVASSRAVSSAGAIDCNWPLEAWNRPIQATELLTAEHIIGDSRSQVITGAAFSDTAVIARPDLSQYRIVHFATHGLVTAPRPECPARPALLTSFGDRQSDGLLSFREIYDLKLNADIVILSACDTAGQASVAATREIGVTSGGGSALDGLVRAFVGAGGRLVMGSHWQLPDDFNATRTLISGLFSAPPGTSVTDALRAAQVGLMNSAETSHPYYWAGFAVVGDGAQPVLRAQQAAAN